MIPMVRCAHEPSAPDHVPNKYFRLYLRALHYYAYYAYYA